MRQKLTHLLTILGYAVPYAFLAMYGDAEGRSMLGYALLLIAMALLCRSAVRLDCLPTLLIGNALSGIVSGLCVAAFQTESWAWYFKPLTAMQLCIVISVAAAAIQAGFLLYSRKKRQAEAETD